MRSYLIDLLQVITKVFKIERDKYVQTKKKITFLQVLSELERLVIENEYKKDNREDIKDPLGTLINCWKDSVSGKIKSLPMNLNNLTWQNLGHRMAQRFGKQSDENMRYAFRIIEDDYNMRKK